MAEARQDERVAVGREQSGETGADGARERREHALQLLEPDAVRLRHEDVEVAGLDHVAVEPRDVALVGARNLDPPEEEFIAKSGIHSGEEGIARALEDVGCTYVALDADVADPSELSVFMPEPDGLSISELTRLLLDVRERTNVLGAGLSGLSFEPTNVEPLSKLTAALGL